MSLYINMRICLIAKDYSASDAEGAYIVSLASGLAGLGHDVTVLCSSCDKKSDGRVRVEQVTQAKRVQELKLLNKKLPDSARFCAEQIGYWHTFEALSEVRPFEVVEAVESVSGALLAAFTRSTPTVVRLGKEPIKAGEEFDSSFPKLAYDFAFSSTDLFSCASQDERAAFLEKTMLPEDCIVVNAITDELALNALKAYVRAGERFSTVPKPHLYRHGARQLIRSTEDMLALFDRMLYDLLFRVSYRFRMKHWLSKLANDPAAFKKRLLRVLHPEV